MFEVLWRGVLMGIGGTVFMDIWAIVLHRFFRPACTKLGTRRPLVLACAERQGLP